MSKLLWLILLAFAGDPKYLIIFQNTLKLLLTERRGRGPKEERKNKKDRRVYHHHITRREKIRKTARSVTTTAPPHLFCWRSTAQFFNWANHNFNSFSLLRKHCPIFKLCRSQLQQASHHCGSSAQFFNCADLNFKSFSPPQKC